MFPQLRSSSDFDHRVTQDGHLRNIPVLTLLTLSLPDVHLWLPHYGFVQIRSNSLPSGRIAETPKRLRQSTSCL